MFHPLCRSLCVCVCPAVSALSRSLLEISMGPGRCCQTSHCGSSPALGVVLSQILAPRLIPASPHSVWGCFCLFFLLSPCRSGCCTQTCKHGAAGEGNWFILALDRTSACVRFPSDFSLIMALEQTGSAHPHAIPLTAFLQEATRVPPEPRSRPEFCFSSRMSVPEVVPSAASATTCTWKRWADSKLWDPQGQEGPEK